MAVIRLSNVWWCQFQFYFNFAQIWPLPREKKIENDYNSDIIFYQVTFASSYCQGTTAVCSKTPIEPSFLAPQKWFNQLNSGRSMVNAYPTIWPANVRTNELFVSSGFVWTRFDCISQIRLGFDNIEVCFSPCRSYGKIGWWELLLVVFQLFKSGKSWFVNLLLLFFFFAPTQCFGRCVTVQRYEEHFSAMSANTDLRFSDEFEEVKVIGSDLTVNASRDPTNKSKNRYSNIGACESFIFNSSFGRLLVWPSCQWQCLPTF